MTLAKDLRAIADIKVRREAGETLSSIGKTYGVTREYIRQICSAHQIKPKTPSNTAIAQSALDLFNSGKAFSIAEASRLLDATPHKIIRGAQLTHIDLDPAIKKARTHQYDGRRYGMWQVIDGSYRRELRNDNEHTTPLVDCICECGAKRTVMVHNLVNGVTRSCGCRTNKQRMQTPWRCIETNERQPNATALVKHFDVRGKYLRVLACGNTKKTWEAPDGTTWEPMWEEATVYTPNDGKAWICLDTGETWRTAKSLARYLRTSNSALYYSIKQNRTYCAYDQKHYAPVGMEDLERSKFRRRAQTG